MQRVRKVRLKPTPEQQAKLNEWAGAARWTYNRGIQRLVREKGASKQTLRNSYVTAKGNQLPEWLLRTPKCMRQQAAFRAKAMQTSALSNLKAGHIRRFRLGFATKRDRTWSLGVEKQLKEVEGKLSILPRMLGQMTYRGKLPFEGVPPAECVLHHTPGGELYLCVPLPRTVINPPEDERPAVALDPGARKFLTTFASDGACQALGCNVTEVLWGLLEKLDELDSLLGMARGRHKARFRRAKVRVYRRLQHLQEELHAKLAAYLTDTYSTIIMPKFSVHGVSAKDTSRLRAKTKRVLFALAHGKFRARLRHVCERKGCVLLEPDERYTSKTCGRCGALTDVGSLETYTCLCCGAEADRDANGARNILLKCLVPIPLD